MSFRFGMFDLAVAMACFCAAAVAGCAIAGVTPTSQAHIFLLAVAIELAGGALLHVALAPLAYRLFRARPMRFPKCPHCNAADGPWGAQESSAPIRAERMMCGRCGVATEFIYGGGVGDSGARLRPAYVLLWPRPLGRWKMLR